MIEFKIGQMSKMPTGEVLKVKQLCDENGKFQVRIYGLNKEWTNYFVSGKSEKLHLFFTEGKAEFVSETDYPSEPML